MFDSLPVIIVTAKTSTAAAEIISEIIDGNDATAELRPEGHESPDRVWRVANKYYYAPVRMHARAEGAAAVAAASAAAGPVGAQVVLLAGDELQPAVAERRLRDAGTAAVNVLVCDALAVPDELQALCARLRLEPVALREPQPAPAPAPGPGPGPRYALRSPEPRGLEAVRAALHAHAWPGLRRMPQKPGVGVRSGNVDQAVQYARAMNALGSAATLTKGLHGSERRNAAEQLVAVFAAAIGHPLGDVGVQDDDDDDDVGLDR